MTPAVKDPSQFLHKMNRPWESPDILGGDLGVAVRSGAVMWTARHGVFAAGRPISARNWAPDVFRRAASTIRQRSYEDFIGDR